MFRALSPGAVGIRVDRLEDEIELARQGGFEGLELWMPRVADMVEQRGADTVTAMLREAGLRPAGWGLPIDWRGDEAAWRKGLDALPRLAGAAAAIGATRAFTWIMPCSDERPYDENRRFHAERLAPVAQILAEQGCSFGLEFVGPKTLRESQRYPFIYTMGDMLAFGQELGSNVGLLLDCWHWYTSHATLAEIEALTPEQVVYVHVNDAPVGIPVDEQIDQVRDLPGATGVIDIDGFLRALQKIGYDGPVVAEPFKKDLAELPSDTARSETVGASFAKVFESAGIG